MSDEKKKKEDLDQEAYERQMDRHSPRMDFSDKGRRSYKTVSGDTVDPEERRRQKALEDHRG